MQTFVSIFRLKLFHFKASDKDIFGDKQKGMCAMCSAKCDMDYLNVAEVFMEKICGQKDCFKFHFVIFI